MGWGAASNRTSVGIIRRPEPNVRTPSLDAAERRQADDELANLYRYAQRHGWSDERLCNTTIDYAVRINNDDLTPPIYGPYREAAGRATDLVASIIDVALRSAKNTELEERQLPEHVLQNLAHVLIEPGFDAHVDETVMWTARQWLESDASNHDVVCAVIEATYASTRRREYLIRKRR